MCRVVEFGVQPGREYTNILTFMLKCPEAIREMPCSSRGKCPILAERSTEDKLKKPKDSLRHPSGRQCYRFSVQSTVGDSSSSIHSICWNISAYSLSLRV